MEVQERLAIFFERLSAAPAAGSAEEALALVCRLIEEVEDEFCPVPREDPPPRHRTGRMYAPQADLIFQRPEGTIRAETRRHTMFFDPDGSIRIVSGSPSEVAFSKSGRKL
jgi:hypothetical protein